MEAFDRVYKQYDGFMKLFNLYKIEEIEQALDLQGNEIIVDIGGGTGYLAQRLSEKCKAIHVLDESAKMLSKVKKKSNIHPKQGDALKTGFIDDSIDIVILADVFHHIKNQDKLINEMNRILNKKGKLIILDFDRKYFRTKILYMFEFLLFGKLYFRTKREMIRLLKAKFEVKKIINKGFYFILVGKKAGDKND